MGSWTFSFFLFFFLSLHQFELTWTRPVIVCLCLYIICTVKGKTPHRGYDSCYKYFCVQANAVLYLCGHLCKVGIYGRERSDLILAFLRGKREAQEGAPKGVKNGEIQRMLLHTSVSEGQCEIVLIIQRLWSKRNVSDRVEITQSPHQIQIKFLSGSGRPEFNSWPNSQKTSFFYFDFPFGGKDKMDKESQDCPFCSLVTLLSALEYGV